jgi:hypothetical protein
MTFAVCRSGAFFHSKLCPNVSTGLERWKRTDGIGYVPTSEQPAAGADRPQQLRHFARKSM